MGNQNHIWQATLSPYAAVFTTNPGSFDELVPEIWPHRVDFTKSYSRDQSKNLTPNYWVGQNRYPRVAQFENAAVIIYNIDMKKAVGESKVFDFTHVFFPKWAFEEVVEDGKWLFGRVNNGFVGLFSSSGYEKPHDESKFNYDLRVKGRKNIYICRTGSKQEYGSFGSFIKKHLKSRLIADGDDLKAEFEAPGLGTMNFSWEGDLEVNGRKILLNGYPRIENGICRSDYGSGVYEIVYLGKRMILDYPGKKRRVY
jgi:hypothetical protein